MKNEVLPNEGIPQNSTISRCPSDGTMGVEVGVTRGTTTTLSIDHRGRADVVRTVSRERRDMEAWQLVRCRWKAKKMFLRAD